MLRAGAMATSSPRAELDDEIARAEENRRSFIGRMMMTLTLNTPG